MTSCISGGMRVKYRKEVNAGRRWCFPGSPFHLLFLFVCFFAVSDDQVTRC